MKFFTNHKQVFAAVILVFAASASRLLPHPVNFTPLIAIALFSGAVFQPIWLRVSVPLLAMLIADYFIGFHSGMPLVYGSLILTLFLGMAIKHKLKPTAIGLSTLAASTLFFLITNFAFFYPETFYPHNLQGVMASYVAGLPFFRNALLGDITYATLLFGGYQIFSSKFKTEKSLA